MKIIYRVDGLLQTLFAARPFAVAMPSRAVIGLLAFGSLAAALPQNGGCAAVTSEVIVPTTTVRLQGLVAEPAT